MAGKLLFSGTIPISLQLSQKEKCNGRECPKHGASECLFPKIPNTK
jgi:hypothetical protein